MNKEDKEELSNNIDDGVDKEINKKKYCKKLKEMMDIEEDSIKKGLLREEYKTVCNGIQEKNTP